MGKLADALRRAEEERQRLRLEGETAAPMTSPAGPPPRPAPSAARAAAEAEAPQPAPAPAPPAGAALGFLAEPAEERPRTQPGPATAVAAPPEPRPQPRPVERPTGPARLDSRLICFHQPHDTVAEQFRTLRTNLLALEATNTGRRPRMVVLTSTTAVEGKTLTAANLAIALADYVAGPVLIVDGDLRRPAQHDLFGARQAPGLSDLLEGSARLSYTLQHTGVANLSLLAAGRSVDNPTGLLGSDTAQALLRQLRESFTYVIIDTPPVMYMTDASILGAQADGAVVVVRAGKTKREAVSRGLDLLRSAGVRVLGTVMTGVREFAPGYYYKHV